MSSEPFELFVNGTLMQGLALHENLFGAKFLGATATEPCYRLFSINDVHPGMFRLMSDESDGISVDGELYLVSPEQWHKIEAGEPPHLYRGTVVLRDGRQVWGILYPRELAEQHGADISEFGGWRAYLASKSAYSAES